MLGQRSLVNRILDFVQDLLVLAAAHRSRSDNLEARGNKLSTGCASRRYAGAGFRETLLAVKSDASLALVQLGRLLRAEGYSFIAVTPETHRRVVTAAEPQARSLRDVFGWNKPFKGNTVPALAVDLLRAADLLVQTEHGYRSGVRFASLGSHLFAHSPYPTQEADAVFFGPDTYRFCRALQGGLCTTGTLVDIGCGSGAGGIIAAGSCQRVVLADLSEKALSFARVNAALANVSNVEFVQSDVLSNVSGPLGCVISNPPYLRDDAGRMYRDGGGSFGEALAVRIVSESLARLNASGSLMLYTGATIVNGEDSFFSAVQPLLATAHARVRYEEIDPDVFGEELESPAYRGVDRIAAVLLEATMP